MRSFRLWLEIHAPETLADLEAIWSKHQAPREKVVQRKDLDHLRDRIQSLEAIDLILNPVEISGDTLTVGKLGSDDKATLRKVPGGYSLSWKWDRKWREPSEAISEERALRLLGNLLEMDPSL